MSDTNTSAAERFAGMRTKGASRKAADRKPKKRTRANGAGSLFKRGGSDVWQMSFYDADGLRREKSTKTRDKAAAERILRKRLDDVAARKAGLVDTVAEKLAEAERKSVADHLADFRDDLEARGRTPDYVADTFGLASRVAKGGRIERLSDLTPDRVRKAVAKLRDDEGRSLRTCNKAIRASKSFARWAVANHRLRADPLAGLSGFNADTDRRKVRRALSDDEAARLIAAAENGIPHRGISGTDRAACYRIALGTGFRRAELASLTRESFKLDANPPAVVVAAAYSKRRRDDEQPIHAGLADWLRAWIERKPAGVRLLPLQRDTGAMLRSDLDAARAAWLDEADSDVERAEREADTDFLRAADGEGRRLDFHGLRHTFISRVVESGASVKVAQELARHSTPTLTIGRYAHARLADLRAALPAMPSAAGRVEAVEVRATGTDGRANEAPQHPPQPAPQRARNSLRIGASGRNETAGPEEPADFQNLPFSSGKCGSLRADASGEGGIRTPDEPESILDFESSANARNCGGFGGGPAARPAVDPATPTDPAAEPGAEPDPEPDPLASLPPDLRRVAERWADLPPAVRAGILAMVDAAS